MNANIQLNGRHSRCRSIYSEHIFILLIFSCFYLRVTSTHTCARAHTHAHHYRWLAARRQPPNERARGDKRTVRTINKINVMTAFVLCESASMFWCRAARTHTNPKRNFIPISQTLVRSSVAYWAHVCECIRRSKKFSMLLSTVMRVQWELWLAAAAHILQSMYWCMMYGENNIRICRYYSLTLFDLRIEFFFYKITISDERCLDW